MQRLGARRRRVGDGTRIVSRDRLRRLHCLHPVALGNVLVKEFTSCPLPGRAGTRFPQSSPLSSHPSVVVPCITARLLENGEENFAALNVSATTTGTFHDNIKGALDAHHITFDPLAEELRIVNDLEKILPPDN